jgi:hypothetical protein
MGLFQDAVQGFVNGFVTGAADNVRASHAAGGMAAVERLCRELGWDIDERDGNIIKLHFKDSQAMGGIRKVCISLAEAGLPHFYCLSHAMLPTNQVPEQVTGYLLMRNYSRGIGAWSVCVNDGNAVFLMEYVALGEAVNSSVLKAICQQFVAEVSAFDAKMRSAGVLK